MYQHWCWYWYRNTFRYLLYRGSVRVLVPGMVLVLSLAEVVLVWVQVHQILVLVLVLTLVHVHVRALALALVLVLARIVIPVLLQTPDDFHVASEVLCQMNELHWAQVIERVLAYARCPGSNLCLGVPDLCHFRSHDFMMVSHDTLLTYYLAHAITPYTILLAGP